MSRKVKELKYGKKNQSNKPNKTAKARVDISVVHYQIN